MPLCTSFHNTPHDSVAAFCITLSISHITGKELSPSVSVWLMFSLWLCDWDSWYRGGPFSVEVLQLQTQIFTPPPQCSIKWQHHTCLCAMPNISTCLVLSVRTGSVQMFCRRFVDTFQPQLCCHVLLEGGGIPNKSYFLSLFIPLYCHEL